MIRLQTLGGEERRAVPADQGLHPGGKRPVPETREGDRHHADPAPGDRHDALEPVHLDQLPASRGVSDRPPRGTTPAGAGRQKAVNELERDQRPRREVGEGQRAAAPDHGEPLESALHVLAKDPQGRVEPRHPVDRGPVAAVPHLG